jgi:HAD superfamily hydrolase (TIGR01458 family)
MEIQIRTAHPPDASALAHIQVDSYQNSYAGIFPPAYLDHFTYQEQTQDWIDWMADRETLDILLVATGETGEVYGYALGRPGRTTIPPYDCELVSLHVGREFQRGGVGRALMRAMGERFQQAGCRSLLVWVLEKNAARVIYEHLGGWPVGRQTIHLGEDGEVSAEEVAYGWPSLGAFLARPAATGAVCGVIFDIDGVLTFQGKVYPGAVETIAGLRQRGLALRFLTNSTLKSRASAAEKLRQRGFDLQDDEVITASYASAQYLKALQPRSAWVMVEGEGIQEFAGFVQDEQNPEYIVVGDNRSKFDFDHLNHALRLLRKGSRLIGMTSELLDTSMGDLELNVGSWVRLLETASGVPAEFVGKPHRFAFDLALQSLDLDRRQVLMVGDRVNTDVQGANMFGLRSVLVQTGEFDPAELVYATARPDFTIGKITDLAALPIF